MLLMPQTGALLPKEQERSRRISHRLHGLSVALSLTICSSLDDEYGNSGNQQHRRPAAPCEQLQGNPEKYQARADPPQHAG